MPSRKIGRHDPLLMEAFQRAFGFIAEREAIAARYEAKGQLNSKEMKQEIEALAAKMGYKVRSAADLHRALPPSRKHIALAREVAEKLIRQRPHP